MNFVTHKGKQEVFECHSITQILTDSSQGITKPLMALIIVSLGFAAVWPGTGVNDAIRENRDDGRSRFS